MKEFTFSDQPNSYFNGRDLRIGRKDDGRVIVVNVKDSYWALNIKSDWIRAQRPLAVRTAAANLPEQLLESLEMDALQFFWDEAEHIACSHGFSGNLYRKGRSGGWLAVQETHAFEALHPMQPTDAEEQKAIERWLAFCFDAVDLQVKAEEKFDCEILEANQALQIELSEYADWVGCEIRSLDRAIADVTKLEVINGHAALRTLAGWYSFATEATVTRKANGNIPARLTADPIMEQVFQVIEARGDVNGAQLNAWLDADDDNDPIRLYEESIAPAINAIEDEIKESL